MPHRTFLAAILSIRTLRDAWASQSNTVATVTFCSEESIVGGGQCPVEYFPGGAAFHLRQRSADADRDRDVVVDVVYSTTQPVCELAEGRRRIRNKYDEFVATQSRDDGVPAGRHGQAHRCQSQCHITR